MLASTVVESRTRWRKGEPGTREGVVAVLDVLREGIGAEALGLFDDDRATSEAPLNLWEAFGGLGCIDLAWPGWNDWYLVLKRDQQAETTCTCGAEHRVRGFLLHDRWVLLAVTPAVLAPQAPAALLSALRALGEKLPPGRSAPAFELPDVDPLGGGQSPLFWVRKSRD